MQSQKRKREEDGIDTPTAPEGRLVLYNISKKSNVGTMLRSACAFGIKNVMMVGRKKNLSSFGNKGTVKFLEFSEFDNIAALKQSLTQDKFELVGVEIGGDSKDITTHPFSGNTAFVLGNEGEGLTPKMRALCDKVVYIPQYGHGTASLNVACAASIVMHHFAVWSKIETTKIEGEKFVVDPSKRPDWEYVKHTFENPPEKKQKGSKTTAGSDGAAAADQPATSTASSSTTTTTTPAHAPPSAQQRLASRANKYVKPQVIFVLGGPGAGKGTVCQRIVEEYGCVHLSAGDLLRAERKTGSEVAELINNYIQEGKIVPVEITVNLIQNAINEKMAMGKRVFLVDGFPRNLDNLDGYQRVCGATMDLRFVLWLDCPEKVMESRLLERGKTSGRVDDNAAAIIKRFHTYQQESMPIIERFRSEGKVQHILSDTSKEEVFQKVTVVLDREIV